MDTQLTRREVASGGRVRHFLGAAIVIALAFAGAPASALAAGSVTVTGGTTLSYSGDAGPNLVTITLDAGIYTIEEGGITASDPCTSTQLNTATCPAAGVTLISASTGDGDDTITTPDPLLATPMSLSGGAGVDNLTGGAGKDTLDGGLGADTLDCGGGDVDRYTPDAADTVTNCEDDGLPPGTQLTSEPPDLSGSPTATFEFSSGDPNLDHFECSVDGDAPATCSSPKTYELEDGAHTFAAHGVDVFGHAGPAATSQWTIETGAPDLNIDSGPSGTIDTDSATFAFSSPDTDIDRFECNVDGSDWIPCQSPVTLSFLPEGPHTFGVRAFDTTGNVGTLTRVFTVALPAPPPAGGSALISRPAGSLVLIAGRAVKVTKRRLASVALNCSGTKECAGTVILATSKPVRAGRKKRIVKLGRAKFQIPAGKTQKVKVRISRRNMRLLRRMRKVNTDIIVKDLDRAGRARTSARTIVLKVPR